MEPSEQPKLKLQLEVPDLSYKEVIEVDPTLLIAELIKQINRTINYDQLIEQISALNPKYDDSEIESMLAIHSKNAACNGSDRIEKYQLKENVI
jgi:hypothetical protein